MTTNPATGKIKASRVNNLDASTYVGPEGQLWYDVNTGVLRLGDNITPGGAIVSGIANSVVNGTSSLTIPVASGPVSISTGDISNAAVFSQGALYLKGPIVTPQVIDHNITIPTGQNAIMAGPFEIADNGSINLDDSANLIVVYGE
jgi:hypothetical protein